jgi:glycosyltransferase involved in cell wall biosynthesis
MKMNKPLVVHVIANLGVGGAEALLAAFTQRPSTQFRYAVIYFKDGSNRLLIEKAGVECFYLPAGKRILTPAFWRELYKLLTRLRPIVLHAWLWSASIASRIVGTVLGIPVISAYHNNIEQNGFLRNVIDAGTCMFDSESVAVSAQVAEPLQNRRRAPTVTVIHNGIEREPVYKAAMQVRTAAQKRYADKCVIGFVGRFVPLKNIPLLIEAFKIVLRTEANVHLILVGSGQQEHLLKELVHAEQLEQHVEFVIGKDAKEWYGYFDIFVQPSYKEGISIALLEALSAEVPAIVFNETPMHSVITDGVTGRVVLTFTAGALAAAILELKNATALRECFKANGKKLIEEKFDFNGMYASYEKLYQKWHQI